eukprot:s232_g3.t2
MYRPGTPLLVASLGASLGLMVAWWQSRRSKVRIAKSIYVDGLGEVAVKQQRSGGKIHVTLDWKSLLGIPFELPFCSAVVTDGGTIYVSGSIGAKRGPDGKPMIVPGSHPNPAHHRSLAESLRRWLRARDHGARIFGGLLRGEISGHEQRIFRGLGLPSLARAHLHGHGPCGPQWSRGDGRSGAAMR